MNTKLFLACLTVTFLQLTFLRINAQKCVNKDISYEYCQLPSHPLKVKKYDYIVYQNGDSPEAKEAALKQEQEIGEEYESIKKAYETELTYYYERLSEIDQQMFEIGESDLSLIKKQVKMGQVNNTKPEKPQQPKLKYDDAMEIYMTESKLFNARMDSLNKADIKMIFKEQLRSIMNETKPAKPYHKKVTAKKNTAYELPDIKISEVLSIRGLKRVTADEDKVVFELYFSEFETKEEEKKKGDEVEVTFKYRHTVSYRVVYNNNTIDEGVIPNTEIWRTEKSSPNQLTPVEAKKAIKKLEKGSAESSLWNSKHFLADKYGYPFKTRRTDLSYAKGKNFNYDRISEAYQISENILKNHLTDDAPDLSDIKKAIVIWKEELNEVDYSNKKARISAEVALGLHFNIIECSLWLNDFDQAFSHIDELAKMKLKARHDRKLNNYRDFAKDIKNRYEVNN